MKPEINLEPKYKENKTKGSEKGVKAEPKGNPKIGPVRDQDSCPARSGRRGRPVQRFSPFSNLNYGMSME